ncbi:MAG: TolC family protein [Gammaproteobacteria bacterium]
MQARRFLLPLAAALAAGCAAVPAERGVPAVRALVEARGRPAPAATGADVEALTDTLLRRPLGADDAVTVALLRNPRIKAGYAHLGIAAAEIYDAGRMGNPVLAASWNSSSRGGDAVRRTFGLTQSVVDLVMLGARTRLARDGFERTQREVAAAVLDLAAEAEAAWFAFAGAGQMARMREVMARGAQAAAELGRRFHAAGNLADLELLLQEAAAVQAQLDSTRAQAAEADARAALARAMGVAPGTHWTIEPALPLPPPVEDAPEVLAALALESRLDLAAAARDVQLLAQALDTTRRYRLLGVVEVGIERERETDGTRLTGPSIRLGLPVFNQGHGAVERARARLEAAQAEHDRLDLQMRTNVAAASARVHAQRAIAEQYRASLVPLRERIVQRSVELQNYMLIGQFELLQAKGQEYAAYAGYLEALRDYWLARVDLAREVGARLPSQDDVGPGSAEAVRLPQSVPEQDHHAHGAGGDHAPAANGEHVHPGAE